MTEWRDQVAVVTGGGRGIGRATARLLAQRGAAVCVHYVARRGAAQRGAPRAPADAPAPEGRAVAVQADVGDPAAAAALIARAEQALGPVTILVNNAGHSH